MPNHTPSPVEYALGLSDEDKQRVFCALLKELIELEGGSGLIPITNDADEWLGYHVPPKGAEALFERYGPKLSPERMAEVEERFRNPGPSQPAAQVIAELIHEPADVVPSAERGTQPTSPR